MAEYLYPQFDRTAGYLWNIVAECEFHLGIKPWTSDVATGDGIKTCFHFDRELTPLEKTFLDDLVAGGGAYPQAQALETVFEIDDLWEDRERIFALMGLDPAKVRLRFGDMSGINTLKMRLYAGRPLTKQEQSKVIDTYASLIRKI